jgi:hypothetical protein
VEISVGEGGGSGDEGLREREMCWERGECIYVCFMLCDITILYQLHRIYSIKWHDNYE